MEQRNAILFSFRRGNSALQTHGELRVAYGEDALTVSQVRRWFQRFRNGDFDLSDRRRSGRPKTARTSGNIQRVRKLITADRRLTVREVADEISTSPYSAHAILSADLHLNRKPAKFIPHVLTQEQKELRGECASEAFERSVEDPTFLERLITGDETWCFGYDPETKQMSSAWTGEGEPPLKKARKSPSRVKVMLICFFDCQGIVHYEFLPSGATVNKSVYLGVLRRLREKVRLNRVRVGKTQNWGGNGWILHHDNAPAHSANVVKQWLAKMGTEVLRQASNSPDLAPADFWLFTLLKRHLKGKRFDSVEEIKRNVEQVLKSIPVSAFRKAIVESWPTRWAKCVAADGEYFEGD